MLTAAAEQENGTIVVHLPKKEPGLEFPDLDLLTTLLQPQQAPKVDLKASAATYERHICSTANAYYRSHACAFARAARPRH